MKPALVVALALFAMGMPAFAQAPNTDTSPGPHDPNPPRESPDLRLPSPCAPTANLAAAGIAVKPGLTQPQSSTSLVRVDTNGDTQCSANVTQSAALPGLTSPAQ